jgi:hypothetical protein
MERLPDYTADDQAGVKSVELVSLFHKITRPTASNEAAKPVLQPSKRRRILRPEIIG